MTTGTDQAERAMQSFSSQVMQLETTVQQLLSSLNEFESSGQKEQLDPMSTARLHITLTYTVNSLFCMYLRTQGIDPETHPVSDELTRIQQAFMRMRKVEAGQSADYKAPPDRDRRKHFEKLRKHEAALSVKVFPEEIDLVRALRNIQKAKKNQINHLQQDEQLNHVDLSEQDIQQHEKRVDKKLRKELRLKRNMQPLSLDEEPKRRRSAKRKRTRPSE